VENTLDFFTDGAQDIYLTGSPSITFFKTIYRRHTSFATESIEQTVNGTVDFGRRTTVTISRNGDLAHQIWVEIVLKRKTANGNTYKAAEAFLEQVEFELGGQRVDLITNFMMRFEDELFHTDSEKAAYDRLVSFDANDADETVRRFYVPLIFSFNKNVGLSLPLIALQYHEAKLLLSFASKEKMASWGVDETYTPQVNVFVQYILLDASERRRFASGSHEYLITQHSWTGYESVTHDSTGNNRTSYTSRINMNHPQKYLAWALADTDNYGKFSTASDFSSTNEAYGPLYQARLTLNGHDRESARRGSWFNSVVPYSTTSTRPASGIYLFSFALKPAEFQPSGTCNLSRVDNCSLHLEFKAGNAGTHVANIKDEGSTLADITSLNQLIVVGENYNVLRVNIIARQSDFLIASDIPLGMLRNTLMLGHRQVNATLTTVKTVLYSDNVLNIRRQSADRLPTNTIGHVYGSVSETERVLGMCKFCPLAIHSLRYSPHPTETCWDYVNEWYGRTCV